MVAGVLFGLAGYELEYRRERQAAGIAVAKRRGAYTGPGPERRGDRQGPGSQ
jgi:DNA invertase Pin-like site-specific DNA recombinase